MHSLISAQTHGLVGLADTYGVLISMASKVNDPLTRHMLTRLADVVFSGGLAVLMTGILYAGMAKKKG